MSFPLEERHAIPVVSGSVSFLRHVPIRRSGTWKQAATWVGSAGGLLVLRISRVTPARVT
jgi:hypothetical protein